MIACGSGAPRLLGNGAIASGELDMTLRWGYLDILDTIQKLY